MISSAAIRFGKLICTMPAPCGYPDIMKGCIEAGIAPPIEGELGFLTTSGRFMDRHEAAIHAVSHHQVAQSKIHSNGMLYCEDMWVPRK